LELTLKKAILFWSPWEISENKVVHYEKQYYPPLKFLPGFPYVFALFLFGTLILIYDLYKGNLRLGNNQATGDMLLLIYGLILAYWCSFLPFFVNARSRHPLAGFLFLIGAYGIYRFLFFFRQHGAKAIFSLLFLFIFFFGLASIDFVPYKPDLARWHYARAESWLQVGNIANAKEESEKMLGQEYSLYMPFRLGHEFSRKKEYELSERLLRAALGKIPEEQPLMYRQDLYFNLGVVLMEAGRDEEAQTALNQALQLNPKDCRAHNDIAVLLDKKGDLKGALEHYYAAVETDPDFVLALSNLGDLLGRMGKYQEAVDVFRRAIIADPENPSHHYNLAVQLSACGKINDSIEEYKIVLKITPNDVHSLNNLGLLYVQQGNLEEAKKIFRHALESEPTFTLSRANLGNLLIEKGDYIEGINIYKEGIVLNPKDTELLNGLGYQYATHGDTEQAKKLYESALIIQPDFTRARINLAYLLLQIGDSNGAIQQFTVLHENDPKNPEYLLEMGNIHAGMKQYYKAITLYKQALELSPDYESARTNLNIVQSLNK
jgi:tetratricopeptide (TPR) repeat protein